MGYNREPIQSRTKRRFLEVLPARCRLQARPLLSLNPEGRPLSLNPDRHVAPTQLGYSCDTKVGLLREMAAADEADVRPATKSRRPDSKMLHQTVAERMLVEPRSSPSQGTRVRACGQAFPPGVRRICEASFSVGFSDGAGCMTFPILDGAAEVNAPDAAARDAARRRRRWHPAPRKGRTRPAASPPHARGRPPSPRRSSCR